MNKPLVGTLCALVSALIYNQAAGLSASAQTYKNLPRAGFSVQNSAGCAPSRLPRVNGLHLGDEGEDRPDNSPPQVYNPGEPSVKFQLVRWEKNKMPLTIWISPGLKLPDVSFDQLQATRVDTVVGLLNDPDGFQNLEQAKGWTEHTNDVVAAGIEEWRPFEAEGLFSFGYVDDPKQADIMVFFVDGFKDASQPGGINVGGVTSAQIYPIELAHRVKIRQKPVIIELSTLVNSNDDRLYGASAHEFGHALGIKAHSDKRQDIMFRDRIVNHLSSSDKATIRWLYHQTPKFVL